MMSETDENFSRVQCANKTVQTRTLQRSRMNTTRKMSGKLREVKRVLVQGRKWQESKLAVRPKKPKKPTATHLFCTIMNFLSIDLSTAYFGSIFIIHLDEGYYAPLDEMGIETDSRWPMNFNLELILVQIFKTSRTRRQ